MTYSAAYNSKNGQILIVNFKKALQVWQLSTGKLVDEPLPEQEIRSASVSSTGQIWVVSRPPDEAWRVIQIDPNSYRVLLEIENQEAWSAETIPGTNYLLIAETVYYNVYDLIQKSPVYLFRFGGIHFEPPKIDMSVDGRDFLVSQRTSSVTHEFTLRYFRFSQFRKIDQYVKNSIVFDDTHLRSYITDAYEGAFYLLDWSSKTSTLLSNHPVFEDLRLGTVLFDDKIIASKWDETYMFSLDGAFVGNIETSLQPTVIERLKNGSVLVAGGGPGREVNGWGYLNENSNTVHSIFNLPDLQTREWVQSSKLQKDGKNLVQATNLGGVFVSNIESRSVSKTQICDRIRGKPVISSTLIAAQCMDGASSQLSVFSHTGELISSRQVEGGYPELMDFSPEEKFLIVSYDPGQLLTYYTDDLGLAQYSLGHGRDFVRAIHFLNDREYVTHDRTGGLYWWKTPTIED